MDQVVLEVLDGFCIGILIRSAQNHTPPFGFRHF